MTEIRFYHLERQSIDHALPLLAAKAFETDKKTVIKTASEKENEHYNNLLWTYQEHSFLPHGTHKDGQAENQPIWITHLDENPNEADVLILTCDSVPEDVDTYSLCCYMFDGRNEQALKAARNRWKKYKDQEKFELTYWQQGQKGWEKKDI